MKSSGFTLIEIIVSVAILAIFLVMAVSTTTVMIQNMKANEHRIMATYYADDLMNWIHFEKENNWTNFLSKSSSGGTTYCANNATVKINSTTGKVQTFETLDTLLSNSACPWTGIVNSVDTNPKIFKRQIQLQTVGTNSDQVNATVTVQWRELGKTYEVKTVTPFFFIE